MNRRVTKATKRRLTFFGTLSIVSIIYFGFTLSYHIYTIYDLNNQKENLEAKYTKLQEDAENLQIEINKLNNPEYLARYAREKYSYSKDGEYIIKINETQDDLDKVDKNMTINYIIIGLSSIIILIFIYILIRSLKK